MLPQDSKNTSWKQLQPETFSYNLDQRAPFRSNRNVKKFLKIALETRLFFIEIIKA